MPKDVRQWWIKTWTVSFIDKNMPGCCHCAQMMSLLEKIKSNFTWSSTRGGELFVFTDSKISSRTGYAYYWNAND